jgi:hypothetical protein
MDSFGLSLYDYGQDHQWVRLLGWTEDELRSVPVHYEATSHATTGPADEYLNLANFGATGLGVSSVGSGGGTSAQVHSIQNIFVYREDTPPELYHRLEVLMDQGGPIPFAPEVLEEGQPETEATPPRSMQRGG